MLKVLNFNLHRILICPCLENVLLLFTKINRASCYIFFYFIRNIDLLRNCKMNLALTRNNKVMLLQLDLT